MKKKIIVPLMAIALICVSVINYNTIQSGKESGVTLRSLVKISSAESEEILYTCFKTSCNNQVPASARCEWCHWCYQCCECYECPECEGHENIKCIYGEDHCDGCCECMTHDVCTCHPNHCTCEGSTQCVHGYSDNCPFC